MFIKQIIYALLATVGFSILFGSPKKTLFYSGLTGAFGWFIYLLSIDLFDSKVAGAFFAALGVGLLGEFFARYMKKPATLYITAGIIPLVPGAGMYYTMFAIIENNFDLAFIKGVETFFIATSIAVGIIISSVFSKSINRVKKKN